MTHTQLNQRQLLIFGNTAYAALVKQQLLIFNSVPQGIKERDINIVVVNAGSTFFDKYGVKPGEFKVVLVGKDGGEKYQSGQVVPIAKIFALIDAMPMRKAEIKNKGNTPHQKNN